MMKNAIQDLEKCYRKGYELIVADRAYKSLAQHGFVCGHIKPRNGQLTAEQIQDNAELKAQRGNFIFIL